MKNKLFLFTSLLLIFAFLGTANAAPIQWATNGHYYEHIAYTGTWDQANADVQSKSYLGLSGHLVTLTSAAENAFVWTNFRYNTAWLGGYQIGIPNPVNEPTGSWAWVTGEEWNYTNWSGGEPNNAGGDEDHLQFWSNNGTWNDMHNNWSQSGGYIVEYENNPVPEPSTMMLFGLGLMGLASITRKRK